MFRYLLIILLGFLSAASKAKEFEVKVESLAPSIQALENDIVLTWWEPALNKKTHTLRVAVWENGTWNVRPAVVSGDNYFANWADVPQISLSKNGFWVISWLEKLGTTTYAYGVKTAISSDRGNKWENKGWLHNDDSATEHGFVSYTGLSNGVRAFWLDGRNTLNGGSMTLRTALINTTGVFNETVADERVCDCCSTSAASTKSGSYAIAFRDRSEKEIRDISIIRFDKAGKLIRTETLIDNWEVKGCPVNGPSIVSSGEDLGIVWYTASGGKPDVRFSRAKGESSFSEPMSLSNQTAGEPLGRVSVVAIENNEYLASWIQGVDSENASFVVRKATSNFETTFKVLDVNPSRQSGIPKMIWLNGELIVAYTDVNNDKKTFVKVKTTNLDQLKPFRTKTLATNLVPVDFKNWDLPTLKGGSTKVLSANGFTLVAAWALWCKSCLEELPYLSKLATESSGEKLKVVTVNLDPQEQESELRNFITAKKYSFDVFVDPKGSTYDRLKIGTLPTLILFDKSGSEVWRSIGEDPVLAVNSLKKFLKI